MSVLVVTSLGDLVIDLYTDRCPLTCKNFLKLCKIKYYHGCLFHTVQKDFTAQTGDPTGTGRGGDSIYKFLFGDQARFFSDEIHLDLKHLKKGTVAMASAGENLNASQFYFTLRDGLDYLDGKHTVFGEVAEGFDALERINETYLDDIGRPYKNIRIKHTYILDDPFEDPPLLSGLIPDASPEGRPKEEAIEEARLEDDWVPMDEQMDPGELEEVIRAKEAYSRAIVLETIGDIPDADVKPPDNVLFVCKLNPVTEDEDLHTIFSRFGVVSSAEIIRDYKTGDSLCYAFIEFDDEEACIEAYKKMDNALIDDRRIKVDFSQSVAKLWNNFRRKGSKDGKGCFKCGSLDHVAKDCTGESTANQQQKYVLKDNNVQRGGKKNASYAMVFEGEDGGSPREGRRNGKLSQGDGENKKARELSSDRHGSRRDYEDEETEKDKPRVRHEKREYRRKDDGIHHRRRDAEDREYRRRDEGEDREYRRRREEDGVIDRRKTSECKEREYRRKDDSIDHRKKGEGKEKEYRRKDDDIYHRKRVEGDQDDGYRRRRRCEDGDDDSRRVEGNSEVNRKRVEREGDGSGERSRKVQREHRRRRSPDDGDDRRDRAHHRERR